MTHLFLLRNSVRGALTLTVGRCPTCSTCTGEQLEEQSSSSVSALKTCSQAYASCPSYLTYIKLCTLVKRNESMAHTLHAKLKEPAADENKRGPRPQDLIRLYDIILQVGYWVSSWILLLLIVAFLCRVWLSSPPSRVWRTTTSSRRRCPSRLWSTRPTGEPSSCDSPAGMNQQLMLCFCRCFFIAQSYVLVKKWSEALVLYERVLKYAKEVQAKAKNLNNSLKVGDPSSNLRRSSERWSSEHLSVSAGPP